MRTTRTLLSLPLLVFAGFEARAQRVETTPSREVTPREGRASSIRQAPAIDGHLNDAAWAGAQSYTGFTQRESREGDPVTERTEVRILTDGEALYVGAWLYDREPHAIIPGDKIRDGTITNSDYFGFVLDTYLDRQNGFMFATTPSGI